MENIHGTQDRGGGEFKLHLKRARDGVPFDTFKAGKVPNNTLKKLCSH